MILVSIIVPTKKINDCIRREIIPSLKNQTFKNFELIIAPNQPQNTSEVSELLLARWRKKEKVPFPVRVIASGQIGPAQKRNLAAKKSKGEILAFIDDDAYPDKNWLKNAVGYFKDEKHTRCDVAPRTAPISSSEVTPSDGAPRMVEEATVKELVSEISGKIAAVCGPGITPPGDNLRQKVSGWVWQTWLGAGGAGVYRCLPCPKREVDDYPAFNLFVRKKDFKAVGGFDSCFWPGEDTKLCHDLVYFRAPIPIGARKDGRARRYVGGGRHKLKKKIIYDPKILVYHHRREIFLPHLAQIARFGIHRGYFVRILPKTSLHLGYFLPSFFTLFLFLTPIIFSSAVILNRSSVIPRSDLIGPKDPLRNCLTFVYLPILGIYFLLLLLTSLNCYRQEKNLLLSLLLIPTILLTHLTYGISFIKGFLSKKLDK